jgi:hypothetical protein
MRGWQTMARAKSIIYIFRRPAFPLICEIDGCLVGAKSSAEFRRRLARFDFSTLKDFKAIDANGEKWMLLPDKMVLAPKFTIRPTRKIEIIHWFNESETAKLAGLRYPEQLIKSRRLDRIVADLEELLRRLLRH